MVKEIQRKIDAEWRTLDRLIVKVLVKRNKLLYNPEDCSDADLTLCAECLQLAVNELRRAIQALDGAKK